MGNTGKLSLEYGQPGATLANFMEAHEWDISEVEHFFNILSVSTGTSSFPDRSIIIGEDGTIDDNFGNSATPILGLVTDPISGIIRLGTPNLDISTVSPLLSSAIVPPTIGLPTGTGGTNPGWVRSNARPAFSGRFAFSGLEFNALLPGGAFPDNFARIKLNTAWTLRRIWVFTKNGPTGGTETYGVVNAAGALQGTAVVLPASAGAKSEAESALQVTNLTGGTLYYLAQTASTAVVASTNVEVGIEYTMNA